MQEAVLNWYLKQIDEGHENLLPEARLCLLTLPYSQEHWSESVLKFAEPHDGKAKEQFYLIVQWIKEDLDPPPAPNDFGIYGSSRNMTNRHINMILTYWTVGLFFTGYAFLRINFLIGMLMVVIIFLIGLPITRSYTSEIRDAWITSLFEEKQSAD